MQEYVQVTADDVPVTWSVDSAVPSASGPYPLTWQDQNPLCRHHHRVKQSQGWRLEQPEPGIYVWVTPAGWQYITGPENHAA